MLSLFGPITIETTLGPDAVVFRSMVAREALGRPYQYVVEVISKRSDILPKDIVGQPVCVHLQAENYGTRYWHGLVTRLEYVGATGDWSEYRLVLRPWLWFLTRNAGCRIFQQESIPDIVTKIFREHGFADFEDALSEKSPALEYVVQYRESDFNFVSRLLEQAGIYYYFKHEAGKHTLVLCDSYGAHEAAPGCESLPYHPPDAHRAAMEEYVDQFRVSEQVVPGAYSHMDYDFERPALRLYSTRSSPKDHNAAGFETYDYPGRFLENADGDAAARIRLEQAQAPYSVVAGSTNARGLAVGALFSLTEHPRDDQNREYLVTSATYELRGHDVSSGGSSNEDAYRCDFEAMDSKTPFRTGPTAEKPFVRGPQTATVVGKDGEDIWTDEYGRVKVQFHWDREGERNEKSSCFVRVSQLWAGDQWGAIHIPRIGQEVIVDFLEGDPDQPIIIGRVYNGQNKPPYALPANQTQSGIKSRSSKGGTPDNFNEIRFEDKKGSEEFHMQAEKDQTILVKNDQKTTIQGNRSATISGDDSLTVQGDQTITIVGNVNTVIKGETRPKQQKRDFQGASGTTGKHTMTASDAMDMKAPNHIKLECGGSSILLEPGKITITAGDGASITLDANALAKSKPGTQMKLDADALVLASTGASAKLTSDVVLVSKGGSQMALDGNVAISTSGDATIEGKNVKATGQMTVTCAGGPSKVELAMAGATVSSPKTSIAGQAMVEIQGALVKIN